MAMKVGELDPPPSPRYHKIKIRLLKLHERCSAADAEEWIYPKEGGTSGYAVKAINSDETEVCQYPVILCPDGTIWLEGSLYLLELAIEESKHNSTLNSTASDLVHFMNTMVAHGVNYLNFDGRKFELPTYIYRASFRLGIHLKAITPGTANKKIRSMVSLYTWLMEFRKFIPKNQPWKTRYVRIVFEDDYGFERAKEIKTTDLIFQTPRNQLSGDYVVDGGNLIPLTKEEQYALLDALIIAGNTEMLLVFVIALVTGMRIQTILTLRCGSITYGVGAGFQLIKVHAGKNTLVDTKKGKPIAVLMPAWLHHKLETYINSERYAHRQDKALDRPKDEQYIFLSHSGRPYYTAKADEVALGTAEKGSAIRYFLRHTINPLMAANGHDLNFSFHDLRATFGMNLLEDRELMLNKGLITPLELLDYICRRMNHSSRATTEQYLNFRKNRQMIYEADEAFQAHIWDLIDNRGNTDADP
jgi:integrase